MAPDNNPTLICFSSGLILVAAIMLGNLLVLAFGLGAHVASGTPIKSRSPLAVKDSHFVPSKWTNVGDAPGNHVIELRIGVKQGDFDALEKHLYEGEIQGEIKHQSQR